ncbi:MAG: cysteine protease [Phycisphaerae bacterium]|nr:cysteine protease [Phycisphaerae bacterium]
MADIGSELSMGWLPDYPDLRDHTPETDDLPQRRRARGERDSIKGMLKKIGLDAPAKVKLQPSGDLRGWCSPIEDQGALGSCTAHAGVGLIEYFERRAFGKWVDASRMFLYKATRNMMHVTGDTGAFLRSTMGAMAIFGVPPEEYWPYVIAGFDNEPTAFCYAYGQSYQSINYFRLDRVGIPRDTLLARIKAYLAGGLPSMFGFSVYNSYTQASKTGRIPYPAPGDKRVGGHAVDAVGYDDSMRIKNANRGAEETVGALLIRNSWGENWGEKGYGWLPYKYVLEGLAVDWWSVLKNEWVDNGPFEP